MRDFKPSLAEELAVTAHRHIRGAAVRIQALEEALRKYGSHSNGCASMDGWKPDDWPSGPPCTCGLAGALASEGTPEEASDV